MTLIGSDGTMLLRMVDTAASSDSIRTRQSFGSARPYSLSAMIERPRRTHRGVCGRRVRVFAIDLVPELVRTGRG